MRQVDGRFRFITVGSTRAFELEASVIGNVNLFVRMIDQESIGAHGDVLPVGGRAELIKVGRCQAGLVGSLNDAASINAIDPATVVRMKRQWHFARWRKRNVPLSLPASSRLMPALVRINPVIDVIPKFVVANADPEQKPAAEKSDALLCIAGMIGDMRLCARCYSCWHAAFPRVKANIDLIIMEVCSGTEQSRERPQFVRMRVLQIAAFLQARIVLLERIAMDRIVQEERKVRIQIKKRPADENVRLEGVAVAPRL